MDDFFPYCGGTIIGPSTILTAAHCLETVDAPHKVKIVVNEHDLTTFKESETLIVPVDYFLVHPKYDNKTLWYDFAVIRTAQDIEFGPNANAACLPMCNMPNMTDHQSLKISGFGLGTIHKPRGQK